MIDLNKGTNIQQDAQKRFRKERRDLINDEGRRQRDFRDDAMRGTQDARRAYESLGARSGSARRSTRSDIDQAMSGTRGPSVQGSGGGGPLSSFLASQKQGADADLALNAGYASQQQGLAEGLASVARSANRGLRDTQDAMRGADDSMGLVGNEIANARMEVDKQLNIGELFRQLAFGQRGVELSRLVGEERRRQAEAERQRQQEVRSREIGALEDIADQEAEGNRALNDFLKQYLGENGQ